MTYFESLKQGLTIQFKFSFAEGNFILYTRRTQSILMMFQQEREGVKTSKDW